MRTGTKQYTNGEITIVWSADKCKHNGACWSGMMKWVNPLIGTTKQIIDVINKCPNKALSYYYNVQCDPLQSQFSDIKYVDIQENGPLLVRGPVKIKYKEKEYDNEGIVAICRCGASQHKPYCDNSHDIINFDED